MFSVFAFDRRAAKPGLLSAWLLLSAGMLLLSTAWAEPYNVGPKKCKKCHEEEFNVWKGSEHFKSYKSVHKSKDGKKILKAAGDARSMKKSAVCATCHYTAIQKGAGKKAKVKAGPSCESCHGSASEWIDVHNDYGAGKDAKAEDESPEHKAKRTADAAAAGMIWSHATYDIAANCVQCHGLANPSISGESLEKMLDAGHPIEPGFELVAYSQGSVRHRFYPPKVDENQTMTKAQLARLFVVGQAAILVSAQQAADQSSHPKYKAAQAERAAKARKVLAAAKSNAAVAAFLKAPSEKAGRRLSEALKGVDLSAAVGAMLPSSKDYK